MPKFNVTKRRGKAKIKIADKRKAAMNKIIPGQSGLGHGYHVYSAGPRVLLSGGHYGLV